MLGCLIVKGKEAERMISINISEFFTCTQCGECCRGYGWTFLIPEDIEKIAAYIQIYPSRFKADYCQHSGNKPVLARGKDGYCVFWNKICTIHPVKPRLCKAWPFIGSALTDIHNWRIMASECPGIRTDITDEVVMNIVRAELRRIS